MILITTTCGSRKEAEKITRMLLHEKLIVCVNMWPVRSMYLWGNKIERAGEWMVMCKTKNPLADRAARQIHKLHSYKLPIIEQWTVTRVSKGVENWISEFTQ
ncbi:hypothetical protein A3B21_00635 [Candidatus Uhrbacteria bacterium RIFCSPLOWO2_01_FULL_47_24]|uniref:Divalent-cation tolerance protein CutA n=1 Tax=Candidatus Uhrbacteria bacterium RIFCSPLOWO2_01_FULL_47_24 TaxID=1802401 RepID=A0A1F7UNL1_9BACT|nr:MAG: hypothetical protein A2753_04805 [Candidatus Uhrbacteria bacterium RIFCSPHIGHO2_01_FULL_47_11]OGL67678.1 MAG: hypothetical protein A3D58_04525 [Candidatus Uhrbacteria bacterium RIFCSPHIGHO2_02_FULL_46_47]OGL74861.1 MAG: hypothetical protein A3F52_00290 [Candidatus Uhrbacteria bacterium RIFCSPHIGHO2_12_FULL_47_11]OGL79883.1 MAG: hypothetical protein A3B21_00635 [Candidatus Uhrbacteria bacterium RIFCSPLOWO2_01_FULL_47_24]OGL84103.1 MAG: hypothetical protein A3J03_03430 [Candidatus Uhrbact